MAEKLIQVKLRKSLIGSKPFHRKSVKGLGLFKIGQIVIVKNTPENRGMIDKANHLLEVKNHEMV